MIRKIITINEAKCNGCGLCVNACHEGAIGLVDGKAVEQSRLITSVSDAVDAYAEYDKYAAYAKCETLRFVVSNTTEAGILLKEDDDFNARPPVSFPAKLCKFLYERAEHFNYAEDKGLVMLPVELIDDNGIMLKKCVKALAKIWNLGEKFENWLDTACVFTSTLVDRIVTGYPRDEVQSIWEKLGYEDHTVVTAEPFGLWVIESDKDISAELPLPACGLPVIATNWSSQTDFFNEKNGYPALSMAFPWTKG